MRENVIPTMPHPMTLSEYHELVAPWKKPLKETDQFWVNFEPVDINHQLKNGDVLVGVGHRHEKPVLGHRLHYFAKSTSIQKFENS